MMRLRRLLSTKIGYFPFNNDSENFKPKTDTAKVAKSQIQPTASQQTTDSAHDELNVLKDQLVELLEQQSFTKSQSTQLISLINQSIEDSFVSSIKQMVLEKNIKSRSQNKNKLV